MLWQDVVRKEMSKVKVAFQVLEGDDSPPPDISANPVSFNI